MSPHLLATTSLKTDKRGSNGPARSRSADLEGSRHWQSAGVMSQLGTYVTPDDAVATPEGQVRTFASLPCSSSLMCTACDAHVRLIAAPRAPRFVALNLGIMFAGGMAGQGTKLAAAVARGVHIALPPRAAAPQDP